MCPQFLGPKRWKNVFGFAIFNFNEKLQNILEIGLKNMECLYKNRSHWKNISKEKICRHVLAAPPPPKQFCCVSPWIRSPRLKGSQRESGMKEDERDIFFRPLQEHVHKLGFSSTSIEIAKRISFHNNPNKQSNWVRVNVKWYYLLTACFNNL